MISLVCNTSASNQVVEDLLRRAEMAPIAGEAERRIEHDIAFHRALVEVTEITPLAAFCDLLQVFFHKFHQRAAAGDFAAGQKQHRQIVEVLRFSRFRYSLAK